MTTQITTDTLRTWLDEGRPVTVLDVRSDDAHAQWSIPGSRHVDAYDSLRQGELGPLAHVDLPRDRPIVTVCAAGRASQTAAELLARSGLHALSLQGGMKAWSLAWNTATVAMPASTARVIQVRRTGKGCLSYIVTSDGEAAVIDPSLPADVYLQLVAPAASVRQVIETHVHADHFSRARQLSRVTGASLLLPRQERVMFPFVAVDDGAHITVGRSTLRAVRTPGHTLESTAYVLDDAAVFTGDTLFTNGVGRPDLHTDVAGARQRGGTLFASLQRLRALGANVLVLPGHASAPTPFDGRPVTATMADVNRWLAEWLSSEQAFVERLVSRLPETPPNFTRIVEMNERGVLPDDEVTDLEAGANRCAVS